MFMPLSDTFSKAAILILVHPENKAGIGLRANLELTIRTLNCPPSDVIILDIK